MKLFKQYLQEKKVGFVVIPDEIIKNYKISGDLTNARNWQAKTILANNGGKKGEWVGVRYILISMKGNIILPIGMNDEHRTGFEAGQHLVKKYKLKINLNDFYSINSWGTNYVYKEGIKDALVAFKQWRKLGGGNTKVQSFGGTYTGTIEDFIERDGNVDVTPGKLSLYGAKMVKELESLAKQLVAVHKLPFERQEKEGQKFADSAIKFIEKFKDYGEDYEPIVDDIKPFEPKKAIDEIVKSNYDFKVAEQVLFSMNGLKNSVHNGLRKAVKNKTDYDARNFVSLFGDVDLAVREFDRLGQI